MVQIQQASLPHQGKLWCCAIVVLAISLSISPARCEDGPVQPQIAVKRQLGDTESYLAPRSARFRGRIERRAPQSLIMRRSPNPQRTQPPLPQPLPAQPPQPQPQLPQPDFQRLGRRPEAFGVTLGTVPDQLRQDTRLSVSNNVNLLDPDRSRRDRAEQIRLEALTRQVNQNALLQDQAARDQAARDQAARDQAARDQAARDQAARDQAARDQAARDQAAREKALREQAGRDRAFQNQLTRDAARDQALRDQAFRDQAAQDQALREQLDQLGQVSQFGGVATFTADANPFTVAAEVNPVPVTTVSNPITVDRTITFRDPVFVASNAGIDCSPFSKRALNFESVKVVHLVTQGPQAKLNVKGSNSHEYKFMDPL
ncbi:hypothetical protein PCANC_04605 [Puccinia coronata f. sp. avenae]|uniref:Uncharacterized protein n=1 Tax=Puccinia coronata f. sp. avenae TaxID=200324 RepID=A0A2N5VQJ9_9BASI|nr:hypothetical protein PCANC_16483 [Puccinia coronata f. sp. avenae]PLW52285.1 hypothetical protein PCASD_00059 [Puccinia coronata f. sp. avenae]PLW55685.1 hypothetical protein PCANC_04605 [Puccinia coronata f. sp. avenae]